MNNNLFTLHCFYCPLPNLIYTLLFAYLHWTLDPKYTTHPDICTWVPLYTELHCRLHPLRHTSVQRNYSCKIYWHIISMEVRLQVYSMVYYEIYSRSHRIRTFCWSQVFTSSCRLSVFHVGKSSNIYVCLMEPILLPTGASTSTSIAAQAQLAQQLQQAQSLNGLFTLITSYILQNSCQLKSKLNLQSLQ